MALLKKIQFQKNKLKEIYGTSGTMALIAKKGSISVFFEHLFVRIRANRANQTKLSLSTIGTCWHLSVI